LINVQSLNQLFNSDFYIVENKLINNILYPFSLDEWLSTKVAIEQIPVVHLWTHPRAFVLGLRDRRLPNVDKSIEFLKSSNYDVMVRNSGGAAVPLDNGILNISIILPLTKNESIKHGYELMYQLIKKVLLPLDVQKGEIVGSYCPGEYDLSINSKKFCGISQRRWKSTYVVQAFILVEGIGEERVNLIKDFYHLASYGDESNLDFIVKRNRMVSIAEEYPITVEEIKKLLTNELDRIGKKKILNQKAESSREIQLIMRNLKERYS